MDKERERRRSKERENKKEKDKGKDTKTDRQNVGRSALGPIYIETFSTKMQTFHYGYTFSLHENGENVRQNIFASKALSKVETFGNATKQTPCNKENVNAENANAEIGFYQEWFTTKAGVDSEETMVEKKLVLLVGHGYTLFIGEQ